MSEKERKAGGGPVFVPFLFDLDKIRGRLIVRRLFLSRKHE